MRRVIFLMIFCTTCTYISAASLDGSWSTKTAGTFSLELIQNGTIVCGQATAISGDKVDASWVIGKIKKNDTSVEFSSGFADKAARGNAVIRSKKGKLEWRVLERIESSWIWNEALLTQDRMKPERRLFLQSWCDQHWKIIQEKKSANIDLQL